MWAHGNVVGAYLDKTDDVKGTLAFEDFCHDRLMIVAD